MANRNALRARLIAHRSIALHAKAQYGAVVLALDRRMHHVARMHVAHSRMHHLKTAAVRPKVEPASQHERNERTISDVDARVTFPNGAAVGTGLYLRRKKCNSS